MVSGKLSRALKTSAIAAKSGVKHLQYLGAKSFSATPDQLLKDHEADIGKIIFKGLSQMRGTALKASQLLSLEADLLPEGIRKELAKSCYQVPPINKALVRKVFIQEFKKEPAALFDEFSPTAFAAASLGQVHTGVITALPNIPATNTAINVAIKVQYPGIREAIDSDLAILSFVLSSLSLTTEYLPKKEVINIALDEIANCLKDEVDYIKEAQNTTFFKAALLIDNLKVPQVYEAYSSQRVLCTERLNGHHVDEWLQQNPSQAQRNLAGQTIFNAFLSCVFTLKMLHADPHSGNYLFLESGEVGLIDFGCVKKLSAEFTQNITDLSNAILNDDQPAAFITYKNLQLFADDLSYTDYQENVYPVLSPLQQWMLSPYQQEQFDFATLPSPPMTNPSEHQDAIKYLNGVQREQMYFDRTYFGVYQLLKKMGAVVSTKNQWIYKR